MIWVVLATYNEADNIARVVGPLYRYQVVVVDGGSTDGTPDRVRPYTHVTLLQKPPGCIASAYRLGFRHALRKRPEWVVQMDAGLTHRTMDVPDLVDCARDTRARLVVGSRFARPHPFLGLRTTISKTAAWLARRLGVRVTDATSGFRCWSPALLDRVLPHVTAQGHAFQLQALAWAWRLSGGQVEEVPIPYRLTGSHFRPAMLLEALRVYADLLREQEAFRL